MKLLLCLNRQKAIRNAVNVLASFLNNKSFWFADAHCIKQLLA